MKNLWIGIFNATLLTAFIVASAVLAFAHPADKPCPPDQYVSFGCQIIVPTLGLTNPEMLKKNQEYWHVRRELEGELKEYAGCVRAVNEIHIKRGWPIVAGEQGCLKYHEIIPATPIVERPTDLKNAQNQIDAANLTFYLCSLHRFYCEQHLAGIR